MSLQFEMIRKSGRRSGLALVLGLFLPGAVGCSDATLDVPPPPEDSASDVVASETAVDSGVDTATEMDSATEMDTATTDSGAEAADAGDETTDSGELDAAADSADSSVADADDAMDAIDASEDASDSAEVATDSGPMCTAPADCPGTDTACATRACTGGVCSITFVAAGTTLTAQTAGDCKTAQCDGEGGITQVANSADLPVDTNECTDDVCMGTTPMHTDKATGTACGTGGTKVCNGSGSCVDCVTASTCPGTDNECQARTCTSNVCGMSYTSDGTAVATQVAGDCKKVVCNGSGGTRVANDDADVANDGNACTTDACASGTATHTPVASGTACGSGGVCNATGSCVSCLTASDCPGSDTECATRTCTAGVCGFSYAGVGTVLTSQTAGDCKERQCDGAGNITAVNADVDVPVDGLECTNDVCASGVPSNPPKDAGAACSGGGVCSGAGACVQCLTAADCAGSDTECSVRTCTSNVCGLSNASAGTLTSMQTAGDCKENQCDGSGNIVSVNVSGDTVDDGNECTSEVCTAGVLSHPFKAEGTSCGSGTGACNGAGACESFTVWMVRSGDGSTALGTNAGPVFIDKIDINTSTVTGTVTKDLIALPTMGSGANKALTLAGSGSFEGALARSVDGRYVTIAGYDAPVGYAAVTASTSATISRVVGRIDAALNVDTTTSMNNAISGNSPRSVVSNDGTGFWVGGGTGGGVYVAHGASTASQVYTTPGTNRWMGIFGGQLYATSNVTSYNGLFSIGSGLPTTSGQTATMLPGVTTTSPYGFVMFDRDPTVTGLDTLYLADDSTVATGGGLQKWTFNGTTWTKVATFTAYGTGTSTSSYRGVAGRVIDGKVYLVATGSLLAVLYVDDGSTLTPAGKLLTTATTNTGLRGVALAPKN